MPSVSITGGGTTYEQFQQALIDKLFAGASTVLQGHLEVGDLNQDFLVLESIFNSAGQRLAMAGDTVAGTDSHVAGS